MPVFRRALGFALLAACWAFVVSCGNGSSTTPVQAPAPAPAPPPPPPPPPPPDDHGDTQGTATRSPLDRIVLGELEVSGDVDFFRFEVHSAGTYAIGTEGGIDTTGRLHRPGTATLFDDDSGVGHNFLIIASLRPGTYYVEVRGIGTTTGQYALFFVLDSEPEPEPVPADDHGDSRSTATRISNNSSTPGVLEVGGDVDFFRLDVPYSGGELYVETTGRTDTVGTLYRPNGSILNDDDSGSGTNFQIVVDSLPRGTYYVEVAGIAPRTTGRYELHVSLSPPPEPEPALQFGRIDVDNASSSFVPSSGTLAEEVAALEELVGGPLTPEELAIASRVFQWRVPDWFVLGCREVATLEALEQGFGAALFLLIFAEDSEPGIEALFSTFDVMDSMLRQRRCAAFLDRAPIEWNVTDGSPVSVLDESLLAIRVWGTPSTGVPVRPTGRSQWWVLEGNTSFGSATSAMSKHRLDRRTLPGLLRRPAN